MTDQSIDHEGPDQAALDTLIKKITGLVAELSDKLGVQVDLVAALAVPDGKTGALTGYVLAHNVPGGYLLAETLRAASLMRCERHKIPEVELMGMMKAAVEQAQRVVHDYETMEAATAASQKLNLRRKPKGG